MAHSWTGNSVTCANWESFWLNEGFTVFIERKVSGELFGADFAQVEANLGNTSLWTDMVAYGLDTTYSSIHPILNGDNPDNSFSELPYERGFQTLVHLESLVGDTAFQGFLRYWVANRLLTSVVYTDLEYTWSSWLEQNYEPAEAQQILLQTDWGFWIFASELPPEGTFDFNTPASDDAEELAAAYIALGGASSPPNYEDYHLFYSNLKVIFYDYLNANIDQVTIELLERIDADYSTTADPDPEVKQKWLPMGLTLQYEPSYDAAHTWISSMGRCKYLTPVYTALENSGQHDLGVEWYNENINFYHPVALSTEARVLGIDEASIKALIQ
jgi:leukotriene-A4 hydrolase